MESTPGSVNDLELNCVYAKKRVNAALKMSPFRLKNNKLHFYTNVAVEFSVEIRAFIYELCLFV